MTSQERLMKIDSLVGENYTRILTETIHHGEDGMVLDIYLMRV